MIDGGCTDYYIFLYQHTKKTIDQQSINNSEVLNMKLMRSLTGIHQNAKAGGVSGQAAKADPPSENWIITGRLSSCNASSQPLQPTLQQIQRSGPCPLQALS